ncbi:hypothetical protein [Brevibacillus reuszeri]|nr:hypothetical protein [Brevibacillus reuszeri]MED1861311.1 hypothetical protein [Brevibacillus reuszeri]
MWLKWVPIGETVIVRGVLFAAGLLIYTFGTGMYISPRLGAGPRDSFSWLCMNEWAGELAKSGSELNAQLHCSAFYSVAQYRWGHW